MLLLHTAGTRETKIMCLTGQQACSRRYTLVLPYLAALRPPFSTICISCDGTDSDTGMQNHNLEIWIIYCLANFCVLNPINFKPHVPFEGLQQNLHGSHTHTHTHAHKHIYICLCACVGVCVCVCLCVWVCMYMHVYVRTCVCSHYNLTSELKYLSTNICGFPIYLNTTTSNVPTVICS